MPDTHATTGLTLFFLLSSLAACDEGVSELDEALTVPSAAGGVEAPAPAPTPIEGGGDEGCAEPGDSVAPHDELCPPTRLVGHFPKQAQCPEPYVGDPPPDGHWEVEQLGGAPLDRYCRYLWTGDPDAPDPLPADIASQVEPDCRVFAQSPMASGLAPHYDQAFSEGTEPLPFAPQANGCPVAVAVVDTAPQATTLGQAAHGPAMAAIVAKLASGCVPGFGEADCGRRVVTQLGLPQTRTGVDEQRGGYFGYQSELAEGISAAVDRWPDPNLGDQKLIVNLAVGWEPRPDELDAPSPAVQAVRDAIAMAQCRGALVVAASGNRPQGTCLDEPTAPGAWAAQPGWDAAQCQSLGLAANQIGLPSPLHAYHPFVHAATPLDWSRGNLADFRAGSNARLAATGFAGFEARSGASYGPLSGSSVATAVVSGVAALVWSYFPDLSADALMQLIYDSGAPTAATAELGLAQGYPTPAQHQVTACAALRHACNNWQDYAQIQPGVCLDAALAGCPAPGVPEVDVAAWGSAFDQVLDGLSEEEIGSTPGPSWTTLECLGCNGQPKLVELAPGMSHEPDPLAWILPQPQKSPCPLCKIDSDELYLSLDRTYDHSVLLDLSVHLQDSTGATEILYYDPLTLPTLSSRTVEVITDPELLSVTDGGPPPARAYVQMIFDDNGTIVTAGNQIPVE